MESNRVPLRTFACLLVTVIFAVPLLACRKSLPTAPSDLMTGIVVYEHADYVGQSAHITEDTKDLKDFKGPCVVTAFDVFSAPTDPPKFAWDDCISSIRVAPGWRATLYRDDDFNGDRLEVTGDIPNLRLAQGKCDKGGFNDCITSVRVVRP